MTSLFIIGAGGFGLEVAAYAHDIQRAGTQDFEVKGFLDDTKEAGSLHAGLPVLGATDMAIDRDALYVIAVGLPKARKALEEKLEARGAVFATLRHPSAYVAPSAAIGQGSILAPFTFAGPECVIGKQCLLNLYASMAHESRLGMCSVLAPYASTQAAADIGAGVFIGAHGVVTAKVTVHKGAKIAAGAIVYDTVPAQALAFGNPAKTRVG